MGLPLKKVEPTSEEVTDDSAYDLRGMHYSDHEDPIPMAEYRALKKRRLARLVTGAMTLIAIFFWSV